MKLRVMMLCAAAAMACLSLAPVASAATQTKTAAGPGLNIRAATVATTTFTASGLPGKVVDVNVAINGISHTYPEDIEATLTGPNGASVALISDAADGTDVVGVNLLFDDSAAARLPFANGAGTGFPLIGGTYQPTNHAGTGAPPDPDLTASVPNLAGLGGASANGNWVLRISDDFPAEDESGSYSGSVLTVKTAFKKKCKKKKGKKGAVAAKKKCGKKKGKASISVG